MKSGLGLGFCHALTLTLTPPHHHTCTGIPSHSGSSETERMVGHQFENHRCSQIIPFKYVLKDEGENIWRDFQLHSHLPFS